MERANANHYLLVNVSMIAAFSNGRCRAHLDSKMRKCSYTESYMYECFECDFGTFTSGLALIYTWMYICFKLSFWLFSFFGFFTVLLFSLCFCSVSVSLFQFQCTDYVFGFQFSVLFPIHSLNFWPIFVCRMPHLAFTWFRISIHTDTIQLVPFEFIRFIQYP